LKTLGLEAMESLIHAVFPATLWPAATRFLISARDSPGRDNLSYLGTLVVSIDFISIKPI
jgi:hypothetical protein